jgi:hypothetical protein
MPLLPPPQQLPLLPTNDLVNPMPQPQWMPWNPWPGPSANPTLPQRQPTAKPKPILLPVSQHSPSIAPQMVEARQRRLKRLTNVERKAIVAEMTRRADPQTGEPDRHAASEMAATYNVSATCIRDLWKLACESNGNVDRRFKGGTVKYDRDTFREQVLAMDPNDRRTVAQIAKKLNLKWCLVNRLCKATGTMPGQESTADTFDGGPNDTRTNAPAASISNESISFPGAANAQFVRHPIFCPLNEKQAEIIKAALEGGLSTDLLPVNLPSNGSRFFRRSLQTLLPDKELESSTIDAFFEAMTLTHPDVLGGVHFFSTSFYTVLLDNLNEDLSKRGRFQYSLVRNWSANIQGKCVVFNLQLAEFHKLQQNCTYPFPMVDSLM